MKWSTNKVQQEKALVKLELDQIKKSGGNLAVFNFLKKRINLSIEETKPEERLRFFVYLVSTLVFQIRYKSIPQKQVTKIAEAAFTLLEFQGIKAGRSHLGFMHGEVHAALSQLYRQRGRHVESAWEQHVSSLSSPLGTQPDPSFLNLAEGNRALRLGHAEMALKKYQAALASAEDPQRRDQLNLQILKTLRLKGQTTEAKIHAANALPKNDKYLAEWEWELACCQIKESGGEIDQLIQKVRNKGSHAQPIYILEARCWWRATNALNITGRLPGPQTIQRKSGKRKIRHLLKWTETLDILYDQKISFDHRVRALGSALKYGSMLEGLEYELLMWIGAARWLARNNSFDLATFCLLQYRSHCFNLSGGKWSDTLGIASDLFQKPWLTCRI